MGVEGGEEGRGMVRVPLTALSGGELMSVTRSISVFWGEGAEKVLRDCIIIVNLRPKYPILLSGILVHPLFFFSNTFKSAVYHFKKSEAAPNLLTVI